MAKRLNAERPPIYLPTRLRYPTPTEIVKQTEVFLELNGKGRKGFQPSGIPAIPIFKPRTKNALLVLAVHLPGKNGLQRTFDAWWDFIEPPPGMIKRRVEGLSSSLEDLQLAPGIKYRPGVRWVEFDPSANRGINADDALARPSIDGSSLAHVEVLMAAAQHRRWVMSWNGSNSPYPNMSGLRVRTSAGWSDTTYLNSWDATGQNCLTLGVWGAKSKLWSSYWASPEVWDIES
jgi:hypothetical protein